MRVESGDGWLRFNRVLADFVLTMDVRLTSAEAQAGIFVRTWPTFDSKSGLPNNAYRVVASQSGAGVGAAGRVVAHGRTGKESLYDGDAVNQIMAAKAEWHSYEITCVGGTLKVVIDGRLVSQVVEVSNPQGYLAFRVDAGALEIKNVVLRGLRLQQPEPPEGVVKAQAGVRPQVLYEEKPQYTREAILRLIQGNVWISAVIPADGVPTNLMVYKSLDPEFGLDGMALAAVAKWRFRPAMQDGQPIPVIVTIELQFNLR